jgi:hypothetical protein
MELPCGVPRSPHKKSESGQMKIMLLFLILGTITSLASLGPATKKALPPV